MKRYAVSFGVLAALALVAIPAASAVVAPPAINMPAGAKIVTEINLSDEDVLGIVKQSIPAVADVLKELAPEIAHRAGAQSSPDWAKLISLDELSQAISGVKAVRLLVARYPKTMTRERFLSEFGMGVAKTGRFNKILSDFGFFPGSMGMFAAPENAGLIGFAYDSRRCTAYAVRVVGGLDVPKLIHWSGEIAKMFVTVGTEVEQSPSKPVPEGPAATEVATPDPPADGK